jgi:CRISPR-associated protein Cmr3
LPLLPVLAETERSKPATGYWLSEAGWRAYLAGKTPAASELVKSSDLWQLDPRVGVGLDPATRRAADGRLFTVQAVALRSGVGFIAAIQGAIPPTSGSLRLGGDGRAAAIRAADWTPPEPDYAAIAKAGRCRMVLATPGLFGAGWLPAGLTALPDGSHRLDLHGVKARLVSAAIPRAEIISGWDLAQWQPKPAQRAAPTGSVYWLDELEATPESLGKLAAEGLWGEKCEDAARRAEGFNRVWLAAWS